MLIAVGSAQAQEGVKGDSPGDQGACDQGASEQGLPTGQQFTGQFVGRSTHHAGVHESV